MVFPQWMSHLVWLYSPWPAAPVLASLVAQSRGCARRMSGFIVNSIDDMADGRCIRIYDQPEQCSATPRKHSR